ncbi:exodeoxyribonuclease VII large subunit [Guyparkeria sp.]|uniref:exodeoxyribonuclease VII large subunit n=1 Tax=Guyparkeria sp. TaxID=2035736 RepID=UPI003970D2B9
MQSGSGSTALSVTQINKQAGDLLGQVFGVVEVIGEISEHKRAASGHHYFALKDDRSQLRCAFFRGNAMRNRHPLREGEEVVVTGRLGIYTERGAYQLIVQSVAPVGEGRLAAEFERLKQRLLAEGLFDSEHKRPTPTLARRIAVISSDSGAAIHDVRVTLARRFPLARVTLFPVLVQGAESAAQLRAAVGQLSADDFDVALIVRGGGSLSDLWSFNDEGLVRAIHACPVPVISGVGHETDTTLCDLVADRRAATPTGAAELATPVTVVEMRERILRLAERGTAIWQGGFQARAQRVDDLRRGLDRHGPGERLRMDRYRLAGLLAPLHRQVERRIARRRQELNALRQRLEAGHPRRRLAALRDRLTMPRQALSAAIRADLGRREDHLTDLARRLLIARERLLPALRQRLDRVRPPRRVLFDRLRQERVHLDGLGRQLRALGPEQVQRRGYALIEALDGDDAGGQGVSLVKRATEVRELAARRGGQVPLRIRFHDEALRVDWQENESGD